MPWDLPRTRPPLLPSHYRREPLWRRLSTTASHPKRTCDGSVAKFDFGAKSQNWVSGIQWLTDANTLEKATLRQNRRKPSFASENLSRLLPPDCLPCPVNSQGHYQANKCEQKAEADIDLDCRIGT